VAAGLLRPQAAARGAFASLRKALRLIVQEDEQTAQNPEDVAHIYKGYAPVSIRLVEVGGALRGGRRGREGGPHLHGLRTRQHPAGGGGGRSLSLVAGC
jgi:hypothetical protein